jgi:hypothetical protein
LERILQQDQRQKLFSIHEQALSVDAQPTTLVSTSIHERDWEYIQQLTGGSTWNPTNMRRLYENLEKVDYITVGHTGQGYDGWPGAGRADTGETERGPRNVIIWP